MDKIISIMQPTYLPWAGYFELISKSDIFIFLDDVNFSKRSWQQRNKIILNEQEWFLTIPVKNIQNSGNKIFEMEIFEEEKWRKKHLSTIQASISRCPYKNDVYNLVFPILQDEKMKKICDLNIKIITEIAKYLNIKTQFVRSSDFNVSGAKSEKLVNLLNLFECKKYYSPIGSKDYIEDEGIFKNSNIEVNYQNFWCNIFEQYNSKVFISHLSIIDIIANIGCVKTRNYIIEGGTKVGNG